MNHAPVQPAAPVIIVDGVFFQIINTGIARVWRSVLNQWTKTGVAEHVVVVDRGGTMPRITGLRYVEAPLFHPRALEADADMLQEICDRFDARVFISTYYSLPRATPTVMLVHDMIPELLGKDLDNPWWQCKHACIARARKFVTNSHNTAVDLRRFFPRIEPESVVTSFLGVDESFMPCAPDKVEHFRRKYGLGKPYFLTVGMRTEYKGGTTVFDAFHRLSNQEELDLVCVGGWPSLEPELTRRAPRARVHMLQLPDEEMACVYSAALALCYPSAYEGFGLPVAEAMACGCPVITCRNSAIPEVGAEAVLYVNPNDAAELAEAMASIQDPAVRTKFTEAGLTRAKGFTWEKLAGNLAEGLFAVAATNTLTPKVQTADTDANKLNVVTGGDFVVFAGGW